MLSKDRCKTTSGFFEIPLMSQKWEEKNYCERKNELSSWRPVALPNCHIHLCLFKQGYDVHALLSSVMYILSGENITDVYTMSRRRWDQNTTQVANRLDRARAMYLQLLHLTLWEEQLAHKHGLNIVSSHMSRRTACSLTWVEEQHVLNHRWKNSLLSNIGWTPFSQTSQQNFVLLCRRLQTSQILISKISYLCSQLSS